MHTVTAVLKCLPKKDSYVTAKNGIQGETLSFTQNAIHVRAFINAHV